MATASDKVTRKGFDVKCLHCGEAGGITMDADELTKFYCKECENEFTAADVRAHIGQWERLLAWIDTAPEYES